MLVRVELEHTGESGVGACWVRVELEHAGESGVGACW